MTENIYERVSEHKIDMDKIDNMNRHKSKTTSSTNGTNLASPDPELESFELDVPRALSPRMEIWHAPTTKLDLPLISTTEIWHVPN